MKFPEFKCEHFALREIVASQDHEPFLSYVSSAEVNRFIASEDLPRNAQEAKKELEYWQSLFAHRRSIFWAIANPKTNQIIGTAGFNYINPVHRRTELSYDLAFEHWGRGIMTEALRIICNFACREFGMSRIQANVATDNYASIRVLEKLNFEKEALMKEYGILHGQKKDFFLFSNLSGEF